GLGVPYAPPGHSPRLITGSLDGGSESSAARLRRTSIVSSTESTSRSQMVAESPFALTYNWYLPAAGKISRNAPQRSIAVITNASLVESRNTATHPNRNGNS